MSILLRLNTGEFVLSEVISESDDSYQLKNPATLAMVPQGQQIGFAMMPFCPFAKGSSIDLPKSAVLFTAEPETEIANAYSGQYGSGIVQASGPLPDSPNLRFPGS